MKHKFAYFQGRRFGLYQIKIYLNDFYKIVIFSRTEPVFKEPLNQSSCMSEKKLIYYLGIFGLPPCIH